MKRSWGVRCRRETSTALIGLAVLLVCQSETHGEPVAAQTGSTLRVITTPVENSAGVEYAQALGLFKKYGLDVQIQIMNSGEAAAAAVAGGAADIGVANTLSLSIAHEKGIGLTIIAPASLWVTSKPTFALVVADQSSIRAAKDLSGKTVAVPAINDLNTVTNEAWLDKNGGDAKSVKFTELPTPQMGAALQNRLIDAAVIATPALSIALAQQSARILGLPYGSVASILSINGWYARGDWVRSHRDEARRFAAAVLEAQAWANKNHEASGKILVDVLKLDPGILSTMTRATYAERFDPALLQPLIDLAARYHLIPVSFPAIELYEKLQ